MEKIWRIKEADLRLKMRLARDLKIPALIAQLLINRQVTLPLEARQFLNCDLADLHDPYKLKDMDKAVARINKAVEKGEKITVWGDYDVDGLTAVALLKSVLTRLGAHTDHYIPHRIEEGYGLNLTGAKRIHRKKASLLLTVDCGISSIQEVAYLNDLGVDTIITDHHQPLQDKLPGAFAIINPLQEGCDYPYKHLAGVGLAFKLAQGLLTSKRKYPPFPLGPIGGGPVERAMHSPEVSLKGEGMGEGAKLQDYLDLVALGTVSDVAPITGENRIFVKHGLNQLSHTEREGLKALLETCGLKGKKLATFHIGYVLGPRLNATGRLGSAEDSLKLLLTTDPFQANQLAQRLDKENYSRQRLEGQVLEEATAKIEREVNFKDHKVIVICEEDWHPGIVGIVASRLVERYYRPTIVFSFKEDPIGKGSGRSVESFHLFEALTKCERFLERFGGHRKACGLTIRREKLEGFKEAINQHAHDILSAEDLTPVIDIDAQVPLHLLDEELIAGIGDLAPFGLGNSMPVFCSRGLSIKSGPQVLRKNTLKFWVTNQSLAYEAVGFKMAEYAPSCHRGAVVDLAYTPTINSWQGQSSIQLQLKDIRPSRPSKVTPIRSPIKNFRNASVNGASPGGH